MVQRRAIIMSAQQVGARQDSTTTTKDNIDTIKLQPRTKGTTGGEQNEKMVQDPADWYRRNAAMIHMEYKNTTPPGPPIVALVLGIYDNKQGTHRPHIKKCLPELVETTAV